MEGGEDEGVGKAGRGFKREANMDWQIKVELGRWWGGGGHATNGAGSC